MPNILDKHTIEQAVRAQLDAALDKSRTTRRCPELSDRDFVFNGIERILGDYDSGRAWLQRLHEEARGVTARATAFDALNSPRRLHMLQEVAATLHANLTCDFAGRQVDHLAFFPELADWNVLAADGHAVTHATHAARDFHGHAVPDAGLYTADLRTGLCAFLCPVAGNGMHAHEWPALYRVVRTTRPVCHTLWVGDRAFIANGAWGRLRKRGHYQLTRLRENMYPIEEQNLPFDRADPVNAGVRRFARVRFKGVDDTFLFIDYRDPETGRRYRFLSTMPETFRPGLLAWLYLLRWKIEKLYDTFKSKLHQTKAWANSAAAAEIRPLLLCLAYNLLLWLQRHLAADFGIADDKVARKFAQHLADRAATAGAAGRTVHPLHTLALAQRMAQMTHQFIRCVVNHLFVARPLEAILPAFRAAQKAYL